MLDFESRFCQKISLFPPKVLLKLGHAKKRESEHVHRSWSLWQRGIIFCSDLNRISVKRERNNLFL
jgi:hypothetical protein